MQQAPVENHAPSGHLEQSLLDHLATAVMLVDDQLLIRYVNASAEMLLELSGPRVIGTSINQLFTENGKPLASLTGTLLTEGNPFTKRQAALTLPSGHCISVDYTATPVQEGPQRFLLLEFQPLDRLLKISREARLISTQQTSKALIRGLAHEIKNPLGGIRGAAQLLAKELPNEALKDYTDIIIEEADRLRKLVDRLLGPHNLPQQTELNIHEILERVVSLVEAESAGRIRFERDYDPSIPALLGDKGKLIQATLNIVRNAMQALVENATQEPAITLSSRVLRQFTLGDRRHRLVARIDIVDNGPGVPAELLQNLFFPMVTGRAEGTGLGLSIAQSILNQHRGLIECTSRSGETRFTLYLPVETSHAHS